MDVKKVRSRVFLLLLYPDCPEHINALDKISKAYDYACICHDKDEWTEEDEKKNPEHKCGELKKAHYHVVIRFKNAVWNTALASDLGIEPNYIEACGKFENALLYLVHFNEPEKHQYSPDLVQGNLRTKLNELIVKTDKSEGEKIIDLLDFIDSFDGKITIREFSRWCALNGYWAEFRRSGAIICKCIDEHNRSYNDDFDF